VASIAGKGSLSIRLSLVHVELE